MRYRVKALGPDAAIVELVVDAASDAHARTLAEARGLRVLSARGERRLGVRRDAGRAAFPLQLFSEELCTLLRAGLPLLDALEGLAEKEREARSARVLSALVRDVSEGKSLSQAMAAHPAEFPELFVALLRASERTGGLADALARHIAYRGRLEQLRQRVLGAALYPALLLLVGGAVMLFLLGYVVPRFGRVFEGLGSELPWLSRLLLDAGLLIDAHRGPLLGLALAAGTCVALVLRGAGGRAWLRVLGALPVLRERLRSYRLASFYRASGILLQGGIPLLRALAMARALLGEALEARLDGACARVREGCRLSAAMEQAGLAPPVALRLLRAGEQSGELGAMMERAADFYEQELARWMDWFTRLFEPLLMAVIGVLIGAIVILMYLPIFELAGSIQ